MFKTFRTALPFCAWICCSAMESSYGDAKMDSPDLSDSVKTAALTPAQKRELAVETLRQFRILDAATDQCAIENGLKKGTVVSFAQARQYVKKDSPLWKELGRILSPKDPLGHAFPVLIVDDAPKISPATFETLKEVADKAFWGAYAP